jgi:hypothetical protein
LANEQNKPKPLPEQIYEKLFDLIKGNPEFDEMTLDRLRDLATRKELSKVVEVVSALRKLPGGNK